MMLLMKKGILGCNIIYFIAVRRKFFKTVVIN